MVVVVVGNDMAYAWIKSGQEKKTNGKIWQSGNNDDNRLELSSKTIAGMWHSIRVRSKRLFWDSTNKITRVILDNNNYSLFNIEQRTLTKINV